MNERNVTSKLARYWVTYPTPTQASLKSTKSFPLPPAKLPAWDGKLKWVEEREANIPPPKPSEALIEQLAKAMVLDPKTGKPLPGSPVYSKED